MIGFYLVRLIAFVLSAPSHVHVTQCGRAGFVAVAMAVKDHSTHKQLDIRL